MQAGKVREIGCSNFSVEQLREAAAAVGAGAARFVSVQNNYNMLHREPEAGVLPECEAQGMGFLDDKNNRLIWTPVGADISSSGDLGYTYGNYEFHSKDKEGKAKVEYGKYTSIWKQQKDGSWKVVLDMGNASPQPK